MDPYFQDLVPVIHNQSEYIQHLEAQVKFCKVYSHVYHIWNFYFILCFFIYFPFLCALLQEELQGLKQRISVVVVENEKIHSELKSKAVDVSYTIKNSTVTFIIHVFQMIIV